MKMWLEGKPEQVRPFVQALERTRSVEVFRSEPVQKVNDDQEVWSAWCAGVPGKGQRRWSSTLNAAASCGSHS